MQQFRLSLDAALPPLEVITILQFKQPGGAAWCMWLTMRGVRANDRPRMSVGMLFTNDLHEQYGGGEWEAASTKALSSSICHLVADDSIAADLQQDRQQTKWGADCVYSSEI